MNEKNINIRVVDWEPPQMIHYTQGGTEIPLVFNILDYEIPSGATARIYILKPSKKQVYNNCTVDGNSISYKPTAQSFIEAGRNLVKLQVVVGQDLLFSFTLFVDVEPNFINEDAIESTDEYGALESLLQEAQVNIPAAGEAAEAANQAAQSANNAAGSANTAAGSANQAATAATTAAGSANTAASAANQAKQDADTAAGAANNAASSATTAAGQANTARDAANAAASAANTAAGQANTAKDAANSAASAATTAAGQANTAAGAANTAAGQANTARDSANQAATAANQAAQNAKDAANSANQAAAAAEAAIDDSGIIYAYGSTNWVTDGSATFLTATRKVGKTVNITFDFTARVNIASGDESNAKLMMYQINQNFAPEHMWYYPITTFQGKNVILKLLQDGPNGLAIRVFGDTIDSGDRIAGTITYLAQ